MVITDNYPVLSMLMVIHHYVDIIGEFLLPPIFVWHIISWKILSRWNSYYNNTVINKYYPGKKSCNYHPKGKG